MVSTVLHTRDACAPLQKSKSYYLLVSSFTQATLIEPSWKI